MMDLRKLEIFYAVVQTGSFSAAAEKLYMTQSAVSQHIHDLESSLGTPLFIRGRRGVQPTPAGKTLAEYTQEIMRLVNEAKLALTHVAHLQSGELHIGATPGVGTYLLPRWIQPFRQTYPQLMVSQVTDVTDRILHHLLEGRLDLAIVEGEFEEQPQLGSLVLEEVSQCIVVGRTHAWFERKDITLADLQHEPLVMRQDNSRTRRWLEDILRQHGMHPTIAAEFDTPEAIKQAVMAGMGFSILPAYTLQQELALGLLQVLRLRDMTLVRALKLVWNQQAAFTPIANAFLKHLQQTFPHIRYNERE